MPHPEPTNLTQIRSRFAEPFTRLNTTGPSAFVTRTQPAPLPAPTESKRAGLAETMDGEATAGAARHKGAPGADQIATSAQQYPELGRLAPLMGTANLTDIFVNSPQEIWIEHGGKLSRTEITFTDEEELQEFATGLITAAGGRLDLAHPAQDVQTSSGLRVHAVLPPLARSGCLLSIRVQPKNMLTLAGLAEKAMMTPRQSRALQEMVAGSHNFLMSGGTGTGKTTLLAAMLNLCDHNERIITVEDTAELRLSHPHSLSLQTRLANAEGRGEVGLSLLIREALRMRPSRLVLGECRGAEIADMLTAMNTGHSGSGATVHANSADSVPARLYAMGALAGMSPAACAMQVGSALEYLIHIERVADHRYISSISRLTESRGELFVKPICTVRRVEGELEEQWFTSRQGGLEA